MNGICGWIGPDNPREAPAETIGRMLSALSSHAPVRRHRTGEGWGIALSGLSNSLVDIHSGNDYTAAIAGRPRFLDSGLETARKHGGAAKTLANVYAGARGHAFTKLAGAFSAVVIDHAKGSAAIAIDRMGVHSLAYTLAGSNFLFSTTCDGINTHPDARPEIDPQAIYDYLYFHMIPAPGTIYRGYRRLLPGEYVAFENGSARHGQYWSMHFEESRRLPFNQLKEEFISSLQEAVRAASEDEKTGCFLSGGTDSSTMAGMLTRVAGEPARTYSIGFNEPGYDEMAYARIAAKHFATNHHEYYVTPADIVSAVPLVAGAYDQPFGNSSVVPTYYCARMAREDGVTRLIGGDGGDELFGGNERYAKQYVFSLYERIPAPVRNGLVGPLVTRLSAADKVALLRKARSYVEQAAVPMPARLGTYNLLDRIGREHIFTPEFLQHIDCNAPLAHINRIYHGADARSQINRMLALDFRITLADSDLPKVVNACSLAGVDVTFPMLADEVVAFSARLAPELKLKGTKLRYFFKEALRGFLPDEIIAKQKHGFGLPFGRWLTTHRPLQEIANDSLQALKQRGIIQPVFIDKLTSRHLSTHAGYYGTMVWVLMMLERWLAERAPDFGLPRK